MNGTVRNITDFGYFVDIGMKNDALLHKSQINEGDDFNIGDIINATIVYKDSYKTQLTLKEDYEKEIEYYKQRQFTMNSKTKNNVQKDVKKGSKRKYEDIVVEKPKRRKINK